MVRKTLLLILSLTSLAFADTGQISTIKIKDAGGSPSCVVGQINVTAGTLTCAGQTATITTGGGSGGSGATVNPATSTVVFPQGMSVSSGIVITNPTVVQSTGVLTSSMTIVLASAPVNTAWITETLPAAASVPGQVFYIAKVDFSTMSIKIQGNGTDVIEGTGTIRLDAQWQHASLYSTGLGWTSGPGGIQTTPPYLIWADGNSGVTYTASTTVVCPFYTSIPTELTGFAWYAISGSGGFGTFGVYDTTGKLIATTGPVAISAFGRGSTTLTAGVLLPPGQYFYAGQMNNSTISLGSLTNNSGNGSFICSSNATSTSSALPATFTFGTAANDGYALAVMNNGGRTGP